MVKGERIGLDGFFNPKNIAIIGASDHSEKVGGILMKKAMASKCLVIPINPSHNQLFGLKCYKSVLDFKAIIDLAVVAIPNDFVMGAIEDCGKKGIKNLILISAGFSEVGNIEGEREVMAIAKKYGIRLIGPNCFGIISSQANLDLTFATTTPKILSDERGIAFVSQSGALWSFIADYFNGRVNFSKFVGLGNMADLEFNDFIEQFSFDSDVKSIVLYVEKLKNGKRFLEVCKNAIGKGKKIYVVKAGSSEKGAEAAFSHTASLASDFLVYKGVFKQAGIIQCNTPEEAIALASGNKIEINNKFKLNNVGKSAIITNAGGAGALLSDVLGEKRVKLVAKSLDIIGTALSSDYLKAMRENFLEVDSLFVVLTGQSMSDINKTAEILAEYSKQTKRKIIPIFLGKGIMKEANKIFENTKLVYFNDFVSLRNAL